MANFLSATSTVIDSHSFGVGERQSSAEILGVMGAGVVGVVVAGEAFLFLGRRLVPLICNSFFLNLSSVAILAQDLLRIGYFFALAP